MPDGCKVGLSLIPGYSVRVVMLRPHGATYHMACDMCESAGDGHV